MTCPTCLALQFASDDSLRALVVYQAAQLDRLTGGTYVVPADLARPDATAALECFLTHEDIHRKPPRTAAKRLFERLRDAGWLLVHEETL